MKRLRSKRRRFPCISGGLYTGGGLIFWGAYIWNEVSVSTCGGLIHGGLIFWGAYIWNEVSVSTCGGLIHGGLIFWGAYILGGLYLE